MNFYQTVCSRAPDWNDMAGAARSEAYNPQSGDLVCRGVHLTTVPYL